MARKWMLVSLVLAVFAGWMVVPCLAATEEEIQAAIDLGVAWMVDQQNDVTGEWPYNGEIAPTGFGVLKLLDYAFERDEDPFDEAYEYHTELMLGLEYIFGQVQTDSNGVFFANTWGSHQTYNTGIAMMAIATTQAPDQEVLNGSLTGWTHQEVVQGCVDWFANTQNADGGWRYSPPDTASDNSNTGYAVLGLRYAEEFGCTIPDTIKPGLNLWIDAIQDPVNGDADDGGSWYTKTSTWVNLLKTGNLLFEMAFVGNDVSVQRVQDALDYILRHWDDPNWDPGWQGPDPWNVHPEYQTMYCLMKGFAALGIRMIDGRDWYEEFTDAIVATQQPDGRWPAALWTNDLLATQWALLVLEYVVPPYEVLIDIKPGSFPNSINPDQNGKIPVAILSTPEFDAPGSVDPASLTFGHTGDEPSLAYRGKKNPKPQVGVEDVNGDGLADLVAHFVAQLCDFVHGDEVGHLKGETYDGLDIFGSDSVRTVPPAGPMVAFDPAAIAQGLNVSFGPNPVRDVHTAYFRVLGPMAAHVAETKVEIYDLTGTLVWEESVYGTEAAWHTNSLSGEYMANGVYIYRVMVRVDGQWVLGELDKLMVLR